MCEKRTTLDVFKLMEKWAPKTLAYEWDPVGMQVGSYKKTVETILVTLDVTEAVVDEAINNNVDLIIAHHPLLFKPIKQLDLDLPQGRIIQKLLQHDITVYASHTNLDIAQGGVNDLLGDALNIKKRRPLIQTYREPLYKIAVFVPKSHVHEVMDALSLSGAGHIGNYSHCTFQTAGQGTFKPLEGTNPFIGEVNDLTSVAEMKIETIVEHSKLEHAVNAMVHAHPYEEVAYDVYPLKNKGMPYGLGRIGQLERAKSLKWLCHKVKQAFDVPAVRVVGDLTKNVKKVAIIGGSGEKYIGNAYKAKADVLVTGDITFHAAQTAQEMGLSIIDPGHHIEKIMIEATKTYLVNILREESIEVIASKINTEPFQFI